MYTNIYTQVFRTMDGESLPVIIVFDMPPGSQPVFYVGMDIEVSLWSTTDAESRGEKQYKSIGIFIILCFEG